MAERHPLYQEALDADDNFSAVCRAHGATRWTVDKRLADVRDAYKRKIAADRAWLDLMAAEGGY